MSENNTFTPITTQEQFDAAIGERIRRARETAEKNFAGYLSPEEHQNALDSVRNDLAAANATITSQQTQLDELNGKIKTYETDSVKIRVASEFNIPMDMRDRLRGDTEDEIRKDAEQFASIFKQPAPPLATTEPTKADPKDAALSQLAASLTNFN